MARVNVEDVFWSDARFMDLCIKLGNKFTAVGVMVVAWKTAQKYWCPERKPIPEPVFVEASLPSAIIEVGLAERVKGGVRLRGSEEHFSWWFERYKAGKKGGKRSAESRRERYGSAQPGAEKLRIKPEADRSYSFENPEPSSSSSFSGSNSFSSLTLDLTQKENLTGGKKTAGANHTWITWRAYCEAYADRYQHEPPKNRKNLGHCKQVVGRVGESDAPLVAAYFVKHPDNLYVRSKHPLNLLVRDCEKIFNDMKTGKVITGHEAIKIERNDSNVRAAKSYWQKKHGEAHDG